MQQNVFTVIGILQQQPLEDQDSAAKDQDSNESIKLPKGKPESTLHKFEKTLYLSYSCSHSLLLQN